MKKSLFVSVCAGLALAGSAMAQQYDTPITETGPLVRVPLENMPGVRIVSGRSNQLIYDNTAAPYILNTANPRAVLDNAVVSPDRVSGATFPLVINAFNVAFNQITAQDFDLEVSIYTGWTASAPGSPMATGLQGTYVVPVVGLAPGQSYTTGLVDLSGLSGGGITVNDGGLFVMVRFLAPGTQNLVPAGSVQAFYSSNMDSQSSNTVSNGASAKIGYSNSNHWRDANGDGLFDNTNDAARGFAWPTNADIYLQLQADVPPIGANPCPADFNGDQFLDFFDIDAYIEAFELGC